MTTRTATAFSMIRSAIRATGSRATPSRVRVLQLLQSAQGPLSHAETARALATEALPEIDRVTLYRVLDWLCEAGLAHKAADTHGVFRYSAAQRDVKHDEHVHFRCIGCGRVYCLKSRPPPQPALPKGFRLRGMMVDIHGDCPRCAGSRP
jgi:Fur family transcriptional regulator, ferric uptake regulator